MRYFDPPPYVIAIAIPPFEIFFPILFLPQKLSAASLRRRGHVPIKSSRIDAHFFDRQTAGRVDRGISPGSLAGSGPGRPALRPTPTPAGGPSVRGVPRDRRNYEPREKKKREKNIHIAPGVILTQYGCIITCHARYIASSREFTPISGRINLQSRRALAKDLGEEA